MQTRTLILQCLLEFGYSTLYKFKYINYYNRFVANHMDEAILVLNWSVKRNKYTFYNIFILVNFVYFLFETCMYLY